MKIYTVREEQEGNYLSGIDDDLKGVPAIQ